MLDSIQVGVTGLAGYQRGLRVIANNTANLNTPGYKASTLQFSDLYYSNTPGAGGQQLQLGHGLDATGTHINFQQGELRQTGNEFDLALQGDGMFMLQDAEGAVRYTRAGQFQFDGDGVLVSRTDGSKVLGVTGEGAPGEVSAAGLRTIAGKATEVVRLTGNLSSTSAEQTVSPLKVFDASGAEHVLAMKFSSIADRPGTWKVELLEGSTVLGASEITFADGKPTPETGRLTFSYSAAGQPARPLTIDMASDVTSFAAGSLSTLAMSAQDGYGPGQLTKLAFDGTGTLVATYSNGQTARGARLALARFATPEAVQELGGNLFGQASGIAWQHGLAGEAGFASVRSGALETSNVDLSREFSDLVVMQRGYQAASQVVSTANDMLQELFGMKRK